MYLSLSLLVYRVYFYWCRSRWSLLIWPATIFIMIIAIFCLQYTCVHSHLNIFFAFRRLYILFYFVWPHTKLLLYLLLCLFLLLLILFIIYFTENDVECDHPFIIINIIIAVGFPNFLRMKNEWTIRNSAWAPVAGLAKSTAAATTLHCNATRFFKRFF